MNTVYKKKNFKIYQMGDEYIVHNSSCRFETHHTHIRNFKTAVFIIDLALHKSVPHHLCEYFLVSLTRISTDERYIQKLNDLIESKKNRKKPYYINVNKGIKKKG